MKGHAPPCRITANGKHTWRHLPRPNRGKVVDLFDSSVMFREQCLHCGVSRTFYSPSTRERAMGVAATITWAEDQGDNDDC